MTDLNWYPVIRFPLEKDLMPFLNYLKRSGILCHVTEEQGQQQLWIADELQIMEIADQSSRWAAGELIIDENSPEEYASRQSGLAPNKWLIAAELFKLLPITLSAILLGVLGTLLVYADSRSLSYVEPFLFQAIGGNKLLPVQSGLEAGQYWRLVTPIFLHFGFLHILFNGLFLWVIGRRIELVKGPVYYLMVILVIALASNTSQYLVSAGIPFGGLSGVVYGVMGYVAIYQRFIPHPILQFNQAVIIFFIVWLLLGVFGIIDMFIQGSIANAAHITGLIAGAILGGIAVIRDKQRLN